MKWWHVLLALYLVIPPLVVATVLMLKRGKNGKKEDEVELTANVNKNSERMQNEVKL